MLINNNNNKQDQSEISFGSYEDEDCQIARTDPEDVA